MPTHKHRLDRFISLKTGIPKNDVRSLLAQKRVRVNNQIADNVRLLIDRFTVVSLDGKCLQNRKPLYLMMHKPTGVISATKDHQHRTVIDLLRESSEPTITQDELEELHIVGRLDLNSSGLLLLTNDSAWSKRLMSPDQKVEKVYEVIVEHPISDECIEAFSLGMYFPFEDITTKPAKLERLSDTLARVTLTEGKYHQIKRMFGRFRNPVLGLHRVKIGNFELGSDIKPGESRILTR
jgi:16S rRNA pseudouridine516 synthase|tara:strand:+ start:934 stop:1644 length:711 start_codon:yes stop_codon:yes gene_type:complete